MEELWGLFKRNCPIGIYGNAQEWFWAQLDSYHPLVGPGQVCVYVCVCMHTHALAHAQYSSCLTISWLVDQ